MSVGELVSVGELLLEGELVSDGDAPVMPELSQRPEPLADMLADALADMLGDSLAPEPLAPADALAIPVSDALAIAVSDALADMLGDSLALADPPAMPVSDALADSRGLIVAHGVPLGLGGAAVTPPTFELGELTLDPQAAASSPMASKPPIVRGRRIMRVLTYRYLG